MSEIINIYLYKIKTQILTQALFLWNQKFFFMNFSYIF